MNERDRVLLKYNDPLLFGAAALALAIFLNIASYIFGDSLTMEKVNKMPWVMSSSTLLLYTLFNTVGLMVTDRPARYWSRSVYGFLGLLLCVSLLSWLVTGIGINGLGDFKSVLLVLAIAYLVLMAIGNTVRWIVYITRRQDRKKFDKEK